MSRSLSLRAARSGSRYRLGLRRAWRRNAWGYFFILPSLLVFAVFKLAPAVWSLALSFTDTGLVDSSWAGLDNYRTLAHSQIFWETMRNTFLYTLVVVAEAVLAALVLATLIQSQGPRLANFFRAAYYLPAVTSAVIVAVVWRFIFNAQYGVFNYLLSLAHLQPVRWLSDPDIALWSVILSTVLTVPATGVVMFSASIGSIPGELYEAARLDGARGWNRWRYVTVPLLRPTILFVAVIYTISAFQIFDKVYVMTGGGPGLSTTPLVLLVYRTGIQNWQYGLASAQAMVLFAIIAVVSALQFRLLRSDVEY